MNCKSCNTRIPDNGRSCPNCGRSVASPSLTSERLTPRVGPRPPLSESTVKHPPARAGVASEAGERLERRKIPRPPVRTRPAPEQRPAVPSRRAAEATPSLFSLDPTELRALLSEQPELLDPGLSIMSGDAGQPVGCGYSTEVGAIDVLAVDETGDLVVVTVAERDPGEELIGGVLQRVGWVRKHLAKDGKSVRAIVLTEPLSEELTYAASAVAGTVEFKTYRVSLSFDDLEI